MESEAYWHMSIRFIGVLLLWVRIFERLPTYSVDMIQKMIGNSASGSEAYCVIDVGQEY